MKRTHSTFRQRMRGNALYAPLFFVGTMAGIAVPAYQDYTFRSKVSEGLNLAASVKAAVAESFAATGKWPRDLRELEFENVPRGRYVTFAALHRGTVVIRYSAAAGVPLARTQLTLRPTVIDGNVVWSCGYSRDFGDDPASGPASPHATTVPPKYLPSACRG